MLWLVGDGGVTGSGLDGLGVGAGATTAREYYLVRGACCQGGRSNLVMKVTLRYCLQIISRGLRNLQWTSCTARGKLRLNQSRQAGQALILGEILLLVHLSF